MPSVAKKNFAAIPRNYPMSKVRIPSAKVMSGNVINSRVLWATSFGNYHQARHLFLSHTLTLGKVHQASTFITVFILSLISQGLKRWTSSCCMKSSTLTSSVNYWGNISKVTWLLRERAQGSHPRITYLTHIIFLYAAGTLDLLLMFYFFLSQRRKWVSWAGHELVNNLIYGAYVLVFA